MKTTIKAVKRGIKAAFADPTPLKYQAGGKTIACSHCGGQNFVPYDLSKIAMQGLLREHYGLKCSSCSHVEFFAKSPIEI